MPIGRLRCGSRVSSAAVDTVEPDVRKEDDGGALVNPGKAVRRKRAVVRRVDIHQADADEQCQRKQLDDNHQAVGHHALARSAQQQPRDEHHDREGRQIHEEWQARETGRCLQQSLNIRIRTEKRGTVPGGQPERQLDTRTARQSGEVVTPGDRYRTLPTAYSRMRSQPMIHATTSPRVAYASAYALPACGIIAASSA